MTEEKQMSVEEILMLMEKQLGEQPKPMVLMSKLIPEWIPRQAQERKFVMEQLDHIPPKYKHLIMIAASAAVELPPLYRDVHQNCLSRRSN